MRTPRKNASAVERVQVEPFNKKFTDLQRRFAEAVERVSISEFPPGQINSKHFLG